MALHPERITVKRRRDEDPIEALYIKSKKYRPSAFWTLASNENGRPAYGENVVSSPSLGSTQLSSDSRNAPSERPTLPSSNPIQQPQVTPSKGDERAIIEKQPSASGITRPLKPGQAIPRNVSEPRRFHLSKSSFKLSTPSSVSKTTSQKHSNIRKNELAVFIEAGSLPQERLDHRRSSLSDEATTQSRNANKDHAENSATPRKRPNATVEERKWRVENWRKRTEPKPSTEVRVQLASDIDQPSHEWDYESPELAAQLQQFVLDQTKAKEELKTRQPLKRKPKPPKPRQSNLESNAQNQNKDVIAEMITPTDSTDYVFDTYVRSLTQSQDTIEAADPFLYSLQGVDHSSIGIIVIEDGEEEELWETFGEDIDSDPDWNSEEEDENAEDYYGNDYPEDEVDSDDELGRGAYNYRHYASDNEQFGDEEAHWSEDETEVSRPGFQLRV